MANFEVSEMHMVVGPSLLNVTNDISDNGCSFIH